MNTIIENLRYKLQNNSPLTHLLLINIVIYAVVRIVYVIAYLFNYSAIEFFTYLKMPAAWYNFVHQPWAIFTYMFLHYNFWHLVFNMLCLYWFGKLFLEHFTQKQLVGVYLLGGIAGGVFYAAAFSLLPVFAPQVSTSYLLGASAAVLAIMVAVAKIAPNYPIRLLLIGEIRLKYVAIATVLISIFGITSSNAGGELAHLGGALMGYIYALLYQKNCDLTRPITAFFTWVAKIFKPRPKIRKQKFTKRPKTDAEYNYERNQNEKNIDKILDKIKKSGYASLTADEKKQLFDQSQKQK